MNMKNPTRIGQAPITMPDIENFHSFRCLWNHYKRNMAVLQSRIEDHLSRTFPLTPGFISAFMCLHSFVLLHDGYVWMTGRHNGDGRVSERFRPGERTFRHAKFIIRGIQNYPSVLEEIMNVIQVS